MESEKEKLPGNQVVNQIYSLRNQFIIIGLTGKTGSGCSTVSEILQTQDISTLKSEYDDFNDRTITDTVRKNVIVRNFINKNWIPFVVIRASDVIFYYAIQQDFTKFCESLAKVDGSTTKNISNDVRKIQHRNDGIISQLNPLKNEYVALQSEIKECDSFLQERDFNKDYSKAERCQDLILHKVPDFRKKLEDQLKYTDKKVIAKEFQRWGNNIRKYNSTESPENEEIAENAPSCLAYKINRFIKLIRYLNSSDGKNTKKKGAQKPTCIVIDSLRNPYEILFFRERYSAFYTMAINAKEDVRIKQLEAKQFRLQEIEDIDKEEGEKSDFTQSFQAIDIYKCIELSDIFVTNLGSADENKEHLVNQIITYVALILHPGLIPPSHLERVMQVAYTAKLNSGCLSRQVGAAVTNEFYSIQSIGWNTVAEGQTPCSLRNLIHLYKNEDRSAFSEFEKKNSQFKERIGVLAEKYSDKDILDNLCGKTVSYCFKDIYTSINSEKQKGNQVHTRSLHAEENAFLQLAKYGTEGIRGGLLFTTASCCELCAKKAYQLGIKKSIILIVILESQRPISLSVGMPVLK